MCYPCSHCGACKVKLEPGVCPMCKEPVPAGVERCPACGFMVPLPPGQVAPAPPAAEAAGTGAEAAGVASSQAAAEEFFGALIEIARNPPAEYEPVCPGAEADLPRADEPGTVGSWPVAWDRPQL